METEPLLTASYNLESAHSVQENLFALFRAIAEVLPGGELVEMARFRCHHAYPTNPMFKGVWAARLAPDETDAAVDEAIAWFQARGALFSTEMGLPVYERIGFRATGARVNHFLWRSG